MKKSMVAVGIAAVVVAILLLWLLPVYQVTHYNGLTAEQVFNAVNEGRKTLAQIMGGALLLATLYVSVQTFQLSREGQITDRFTKAIEQLGATDDDGKPILEIRLGGIYALERIAHDSKRDHPVIMEVLTAYVRENSPWRGGDANVRTDVQAILDVLWRRNRHYDPDEMRPNLRGIDLCDTKLIEVHLEGADLTAARLEGANLMLAHLEGSDLTEANLEGARLWEARLGGARLFGASLEGADLSGAQIQGTDLSQASLQGAILSMSSITQE